ncbi:MAG: helix-turn-helix domain-containing protein [Bryobacteraceae bacterium]|nr:helix-turn-helix domain-containing protein [Bryobacteraceae bacterium]
MDDSQLKLPFMFRLRETVDTSTAARIAKVSEETIRRWCDTGKLPAYKLVGRWRIHRVQFIRWLDALQRDVAE